MFSTQLLSSNAATKLSQSSLSSSLRQLYHVLAGPCKCNCKAANFRPSVLFYPGKLAIGVIV